MKETDEEYLALKFQSCCEQYFIEKFQQNRFLYFNDIPHGYFGTNYRVEIININFDWVKNADITYDTYVNQDHDYGKKRCKFLQSCSVSYIFKINSLLSSDKKLKTIKFYADSLEPIGKIISSTIIDDDLVTFDTMFKVKLKIKNDFKVRNIGEIEYGNHPTGFGFFAHILRKERRIKATQENISHGYFYEEIAFCHKEIEECLLNVLFHQKYSSDLLGRRIMDDCQEFYLPNLSYNDFQYLIMVGFGLDRLYSFWDRITFLIHSYESLGFKQANISFDKYFNKINQKNLHKERYLFNKDSENIKWLNEFHEKHFGEIIKYRHRIVHYQMTPNWEGALSSMFANNATELISNRDKLNELKMEFEGLGNVLYRQFNYCTDGFIKILNLIDELD